jgi:peptidyl-prolyl cis-trans isomerase A (cyclophilin A)
MRWRRLFHLFAGFGLIVCLGGQTCNTLTTLAPAAARPPPAIIPSGNSPESLTMVLTVDLRDYPETNRVTWEFGDGSMSANMKVATGKSVAHGFPGEGVFLVRVHLFDGGDGLRQIPPKEIAVGSLPVEVVGPNETPIASFQILDVLDASGVASVSTKRFNAVTSRDPDGTISRFAWDFGDDMTGEGRSLTHTYAAGGRYTVRLTVTDNRDATADATRSLLINAPPTSQFTFDVSTVDQLTVSFNGGQSSDADGTLALLRWDFGDGTPVETGVVVTHTYAAPGTYTVTLTAIDNFGSAAVSTQSVHVSGIEVLVQSVTPDFGVVDTTITDVSIRGENFAEGMLVHLGRGTSVILGTALEFIGSTEIRADFALTGAELGDYDVVVTPPGPEPARLTDGFRVVTADRIRLTTSLGDIVIRMASDAPITTANYFQYVQDRFYDGTIFHRVIPGFVVQGGGFLPGLVPQTPVRGPIQNEFSPSRSNVRGTLAMAKVANDPNSATSEFFFNLADNSANLDNQNGGFTVFANVIEGLDVVDAIAGVPLDGEQPVTDVVLIRARRE